MMEGCRSPSLQRSRYVSWIGASTPEFSHLAHLSDGLKSALLLLLSPKDSSSRAHTRSTFSHQPPRPTVTNPEQSCALYGSVLVPGSHPHESDDSDKGKKVDSRHPESDNWYREDPSLLQHQDNNMFLPRSSPVISRHRRSEVSTSTTVPSSLDSPFPDSGPPSPDHNLTETSTGCLPSNQSSRLNSCCSSISPSLDSLLNAEPNLPISGQLRSDAEHKCHGERTESIPEFTADTFRSSCEVEQVCYLLSADTEYAVNRERFDELTKKTEENSHFIVVDMVLEVLEVVKWNMSLDQRTLQLRMCSYMRSSTVEPEPETCAITHSHSQTHDEEEEAEDTEAQHQPEISSFLSTDSIVDDRSINASKDSPGDAEDLAQQLLKNFRRNWFPSSRPRRGRQSLRSSMQEFQGSEVVMTSSSLTEEIRLRTRMRGSLSWAPPRFQIIFTVQPTLRRSEVVTGQNFLCAGCGTEVEPKYIKRLKYCEYLGRYFCECCHSGSEERIPARVLSCWDFNRYPVSDFAKDLLQSIWYHPLFDLTSIDKNLFSRIKDLDKFRELQNQLLNIQKLLKLCIFCDSVMNEFEQFPAHLLKQPHLFSMDDLLRMKKGLLVAQAKAMLQSALYHVKNCELCLARGFICEFCRQPDVIFPFQRETCQRCPVCRTYFHKHCFVGKKCPKCARIQSWKKRQDESMMEEIRRPSSISRKHSLLG